MVMFSIFLQCIWLGVVLGMRRGDHYNPSAYPWLAGLLTEEWYPRCSGTVVSEFYVLTASACLIHKTDNASWDLIDPNRYVVVIPAESPLNTVREIDVILVHPNVTVGPKYNAGLIGIWPFLKFREGATVLPIWPGNMKILGEGLDYVLRTIETFRCFLITWRDVFHGIHGRSHPPYKVDWVSAVEVRPHHEMDCKNLICRGTSNATTCQKKLSGTMCLNLVMPRNSQLCGADRGAGLSCSHFLWGVLVGGASCTNSDPMPITLRIDVVADFIIENYNKPFRRTASKSSVVEPNLPQSLLIAIIFVIFKMIVAITK